MVKVKFNSFQECRGIVVVEGNENIPDVPIDIGRGIISIMELKDGVPEERKAIRMGCLRLRDNGYGYELCLLVDKADAYLLAAEIAAILFGDAAVERMEAHFGGEADG